MSIISKSTQEWNSGDLFGPTVLWFGATDLK